MSGEERFMQGLSRQQELPLLHIFGNQCTYEKLMENFNGRAWRNPLLHLPSQSCIKNMNANGVRFIAMEASHIDRGDARGLIYIVEAQGKTFLYATDSGPTRRKPGTASRPTSSTR